MKITIEKREVDSKGRRALRLVYSAGSQVDPVTGKRIKRRRREPLELFVYNKPKNSLEKNHNKDALDTAESIRAKKVVEIAKGKHQFVSDRRISTDFYVYIEKIAQEKSEGSKSNHSVWISAIKHLKIYNGRPELSFEEINKEFLEGFRNYLISRAIKKDGEKLSKNSQASYFGKIKAALSRAHDEGILHENPTRGVKRIQPERTKRVYLTLEEMKSLAAIDHEEEVLKRAFIFSCCTGLRWSDIHKLTWSEVDKLNENHRIIFSHQKTSSLQYLDMNKTARKMMGEPGKPAEKVFKGLKYSSYNNSKILRWAMEAGIQKHVTFHSGRHTFAVIQLNRGIDIYTLSKLLGHSELRTTEIYADIIESRRVEAMITFPEVF